MGIDYSGVGGIGIKLTDEMVSLAVRNGLFTDEEWEEDPLGCMEEFGIEYDSAGNDFCDDSTYYLLVEGKTLNDINSNSTKFIDSLKIAGIEISKNELLVISDIHIY
jgi:hypothetical protein